MNKDNINKVIDRIRAVSKSPNEQFTMRRWISEFPIPKEDGSVACGTAGCICGWTVFAMGDDFVQSITSPYSGTRLVTMEVQIKVAQWLGIPVYVSEELFQPDEMEAYDATAEEAIKVLEILRDTGEVRWGEALS